MTTKNSSTPKPLDVLNGKTIELPAEVVVRAYTVAALSDWTPSVDNPFKNLKGTVTCDMRIIGEAYIVAISQGWQPAADDPLAHKLLELGIIKPQTKS